MDGSAEWDRLPAFDASATPRSRNLWWMYLLVVFALAGMGAGAAQALFDTHNLGENSTVVTCLARHGLTNFDGTSHVSAKVGAQFAACVDPFGRRHGVAMLIGAGVMLVAAWALMLGGGFGVRWSLRRDRFTASPATEARAEAAVTRFNAWCAVWRLNGRRRPRLLLTASGTRQAFTTGLPLARPLVVVPVSYVHTEPAMFDVAVLHELAHVRSRDLLWASWVWWAGWLNIPALLLAVGSTFDRPLLPSHYSASLWLSAALSVAVLVLRAALLRRRELAADRYAVEVLGDPGALRAALGPEAAPVARLTRYVRRLTASHPAAGTRAGADPASLDRWEGGFAVTAATSVIAMFTFQGVYLALVNFFGVVWGDPQLPGELAFAAASLLWACVVVPAWTRRAEAASRTGSPPTWWGPVAGMALGLPLGYRLQIPGASTAVGADRSSGPLLVLCLLLAVVMAGVGTLVAGLVSNLVGTGRPRTLVAVVATAAIALATALNVATNVLQGHARSGNGALDRTLLMGQGDVRVWRFVPLLLLIGFLLAARTPGTRVSGMLPRACWPLMAPAAVVGGLAAGLSWQLRIAADRPPDTLYLLFYQRLWICALAGWTVVAAALLTGRSGTESPGGARPLSRLPAALTAGFVTAILAGLVQFGYTAALRYGRNLPTFERSLRMPVWLLLVALVVTLPWLLGAAALIDRRRPPLGNVSAILGTAVFTGAVAVIVVSGAVSPLTVAPHDYSRSSSVAAQATPGPPGPPDSTLPAQATPGTGRTADPGRALSGTAAARAVANIAGLLPPGRKLVKNDEGGRQKIRPTTCQDLFDRDDAAEKARPRNADVTRTYTFPARGTTSDGIELKVDLTSYGTPMGDLGFLRNEAARCPRLTLLAAGVSAMRASLTEKSPPALPYPTDRSDLVVVGHAGSLRVVTTQLTDTVLVGHNLASAQVTYSYFNVPPSEAVRSYSVQLAATALTTIIRDLQQAG
ncbi:M48 family metalloprotease [Actinomadura sp. DC4]|uniref:M48 family metalloprotease n=1 Tax=Actinomadura sp. DC4 TaxID=3055069 RepID=UPI0025B182C3|nr:M48 family metalloprotease [Actinomadura sp. DC4]MDN3357882.1 M48 family metalloprotease [Actinomadura sp. DC4]